MIVLVVYLGVSSTTAVTAVSYLPCWSPGEEDTDAQGNYCGRTNRHPEHHVTFRTELNNQQLGTHESELFARPSLASCLPKDQRRFPKSLEFLEGSRGRPRAVFAPLPRFNLVLDRDARYPPWTARFSHAKLDNSKLQVHKSVSAAVRINEMAGVALQPSFLMLVLSVFVVSVFSSRLQ